MCESYIHTYIHTYAYTYVHTYLTHTHETEAAGMRCVRVCACVGVCRCVYAYIYIQAAAGGGGSLSVRDALEVVLYAFARLGQRGQAEVLADEESPHMTILLSALSRLLVVHKGGVGDKDLKMACNLEATEVLLIDIDRKSVV